MILASVGPLTVAAFYAAVGMTAITVAIYVVMRFCAFVYNSLPEDTRE